MKGSHVSVGIILLFMTIACFQPINAQVKMITPQTQSLFQEDLRSTTPQSASSSRGGFNWTETQKLKASDHAALDLFGCSVALNGDTALIAAAGKGSVYVFSKTNTIWTQQPDLLTGDGSAQSGHISLDGDTALIGTPGYDHWRGAVNVFIRIGTTWTLQAQLLASDGEQNDWFGWSVSLNGDTAIVGAPYDSDGGSNTGSVYVFIRTGTTWTQQQKILPSDSDSSPHFGWSVSLSGDAALIGKPWDDDHGEASGSVYVFTRTSTTWTQQVKLHASDSTHGDFFGISVSLDHDTALIGASGYDDYKGAMYIFEKNGNGWRQQAKLLASDGATEDLFGYSVSLRGGTALAGASYHNHNGEMRGSVYAFTRIGPTWTLTQEQELLASDGEAYDHFGCSVCVSGDTALIGAYGTQIKTGSAYIFTREGGTPLVHIDAITGGIGINVVITNNGTEDATGVAWHIHAGGGIYGRVNRTKSGTIDILAGDSKTVGTGLFFGLGPIEITVTVIDEERSANGTQFFIFSKIK